MKFKKINEHFFGDQAEGINQTYMYLHGDIDHDSTGPIIQEIIQANMDAICETCGGTDPECTDCDLVDAKEDVINVLICSPGGEVPAAMSLIAVMEASEIPIRTIALGECGSAALMILMAGHQRVVTPYSSILSHQFMSGMEGSFSNIKASVIEFDNYHEKIVKFYMERTSLDRETIEKHLLKDVDSWLKPEDAIKFGLADLVSDLK